MSVGASEGANSGAIQVNGEVLDVQRTGKYVLMSVTAPGITERARPGQFVTIGIGGEESSMVLRRSFAIQGVQARGMYGGTLDFVVSLVGKGTQWLTKLRRHDPINLVGPLGKPFTLPTKPVTCVLVGGGYGAAPLIMLAQALRERGCRVDTIIGASTEEKLYGGLDLKRVSTSLTLATEDGTAGIRGRVTDGLIDTLNSSKVDVVYACGPMSMLASVAEECTTRKIFSQCSVEESMACGIGVCMTCVLPVIGEDGVTRMLRSCVEGPIFRGDRVRWADIGTIPEGTWGGEGLRSWR
jgi:dihydroorotate dehydrogenase electron transfer subunit